MAIVDLTGISSLRLAAKCSNVGLHIDKNGVDFRELKLSVCHLFLASGVAIFATFLFVCGIGGLAIYFDFTIPILVTTCVKLSL